MITHKSNARASNAITEALMSDFIQFAKKKNFHLSEALVANFGFATPNTDQISRKKLCSKPFFKQAMSTKNQGNFAVE